MRLANILGSWLSSKMNLSVRHCGLALYIFISYNLIRLVFTYPPFYRLVNALPTSLSLCQAICQS